MTKAENRIIRSVLLLIAFAAMSTGAWLTHIVSCIKAGTWGFLIAGAIMPPIGIIHGFGIWIGAW
jgi:hypothetical protein